MVLHSEQHQIMRAPHVFNASDRVKRILEVRHDGAIEPAQQLLESRNIEFEIDIKAGGEMNEFKLSRGGHIDTQLQ
jgi:hypothetical protein